MNATRVLVPAIAAEGYMPERKHPGDAGYDLRYFGDYQVLLLPGHRANLPVGLRLEIPAGHLGLVCPRSGVAVQHGITVLNSPGIIDSGYRGEIRVPLINLGLYPYTIKPEDRIAQLIILSVFEVSFISVVALGESERGTGGFGSTGVE